MRGGEGQGILRQSVVRVRDSVENWARVLGGGNGGRRVRTNWERMLGG